MILKISLINNSMIVVLPSGKTIFTNSGTKELFYQVQECQTEQEVKQLLTPELCKEEEEIRQKQEEFKEFIEDVQKLSERDEFLVKDKSVYIKGIDRTLPELLVKHFIGALGDEDQITSLKNFWYWCCLNPRAEVCNNLFEFLTNNLLRINKQGFFYALRNVVSKSDDSLIVRFVSEQYVKVKNFWKEDPKSYWVMKGILDDGIIGEEEAEILATGREFYHITSIYQTGENNLGNLQDVYTNLPQMKENRFTDNYTRTFDIRIGRRVSIDPAKCSWSTVDCGEAGLHATLNEINYVGCGDTSVIVLINPSKVVGIGTTKLRCWEYLPIATVPRQEATQVLEEMTFSGWEIEQEYIAEEIQDLEQKAKTGFAKEATKHEFNIPLISSQEIKSISEQLQEIKETLEERVVLV